MRQEGIVGIFVLVLILVLTVAGGAYYLGAKGIFNLKQSSTGRACTEEAKICPDGTSVGRVGPNCEFTECPVSNETANWKTYTNANLGFQMRYPDNVEITYEGFNIVIIKGNFSYGQTPLFLISKDLTDLSEYKECAEDPIPQDLYPCYRKTKDRYSAIRRLEKLGDAEVMDIETAHQGTGKSERVIREISNPKIEILRGYGTGYESEAETLFAEILSTFKFTSQ